MAAHAGIPPEVYFANLKRVQGGAIDIKKYQLEYQKTQNLYTARFPMHPKQKAFLMLPQLQAMGGGSSGTGKATPNYTLIQTPTGPVPMGTLRVGDYVIGSDGNPTRVTGVYPQGLKPCKRILFTNTTVDASDDHLWTVQRVSHGKRVSRTVKTVELRANQKRDQLPMLSAPTKFSGVDPEGITGYELGYFLGNGYGHTYLRPALEKLGLLSGQPKDIPASALHASPEFRVALLQGLMDSDGSVRGSRNRLCFSTTILDLAESFVYLVQNLGGTAKVNTNDRVDQTHSVNGKDYTRKSVEYEVSLKLPTWVSPFRLARKAARFTRTRWCQPFYTFRSIEDIGEHECTCISVEAEDCLFAISNGVLTHNSQLLVNAALQYVTRPNYRALVLRRTLGQLASPNSIMDRTLRTLQGLPFQFNRQSYELNFPSGAVIKFGHMNTEQDKFQYDGPEFHGIFIDEASQFSQTQLEFMFLRLRKTVDDPIPLRYRLASNPGNISHMYLRDTYVLNQGKNPDIAYIPFYIEDNPSIDLEQYEKALKNLDPLTYRQRRFGDWMATRTDAVFQREWFSTQDIPVSGNCLRMRFWDLAATDPKANTDPDYTVGILLARDSVGRFVVEDMQRFRANPAIVEQRVIGTMKSDGANVYQRIEKEPGASGKSLIHHFIRSMPGYNIAGVTPGGPKRARWSPFAAQAKGGNVWVVSGPWASDWFQEICGLTGDGDPHDDIGDATAGAFNTMVSEFLLSTPGLSRL
jgi:predicted phage terminase large subunit-like protein